MRGSTSDGRDWGDWEDGDFQLRVIRRVNQTQIQEVAVMDGSGEEEMEQLCTEHTGKYFNIVSTIFHTHTHVSAKRPYATVNKPSQC